MPPPPPTSAQRRALDLLHRHSYAIQAFKEEKPFWVHGEKIPWNIVSKLMAQGLVKRVTVQPGAKFPDGRVNHSPSVFFIICLTRLGKELYQDA